MKNNLKKIQSFVWRAIIEFNLIQANDKILIGLSGGKDSLLLLKVLHSIQPYSPQPFTLAALTVEPGFPERLAIDKIAQFCQDIGVEFYCQQENIANIISRPNCPNPCYSCGLFRRAALSSFAVKNGFTKIALAHHLDDAVETFVMNLFFNGKLGSFQPISHMDRSNVTVIRPLIYMREHEILSTVKALNIKPCKSPCPYNGHTNRQSCKELIASWNKISPDIFSNLLSAMRCSQPNLWPQKPQRESLRQLFCQFWQNNPINDSEN